MNNQPVRVGDRVRIEGGRWDGNTGRVAVIKNPEDVLFKNNEAFVMGSGFLNEEMALVEFSTPLDMVGGRLDSVGVPVRRLKAI